MNNTLSKSDAIRNLAERTGLKHYEAKAAVETLLTEIKETLAQGDRVEFRGFGVWSVRLGKPRMGRNMFDPNGPGVPIPARPTLRFRQSNQLKNAVQASADLLSPE